VSTSPLSPVISFFLNLHLRINYSCQSDGASNARLDPLQDANYANDCDPVANNRLHVALANAR